MMEPAKKKCKGTSGSKGLWTLNVCVACTKPLDSTSKILQCLHGMCKRCFELNSKVSDHFVCKCGKETDLSTVLINYSFTCEQFDEIILKHNFMDQEYQQKLYGKYKTKAPCPNCVDKFIEIYCITCTIFHCTLCHLSSHRHHNRKTIWNVMEEIRSKLFENKVDLCEKSDFAAGAKLCVASETNKLKTQKIGMIKKIGKQFNEIRAELSMSEHKMKNYIETYYNGKLEKTTKTTSSINELKEKYDFYLNFSESILMKKNNADLDIANLVNKQLENVRKDFKNDISKLESLDINNSNIDLKAEFHDTLNQLNESIKRIVIHNPHIYEEEINEISKTANITSYPGYLDAMRDIATSPTIVDDNQVKKITEYNCARLERKRLMSSADEKSNKIIEYNGALQKRKRFYSTDEESSHSDNDTNNEIQRDISTSPTIVDDNQVKKITEYNSTLKKRKRFYSTDEESSHSDTDSNNEIQRDISTSPTIVNDNQVKKITECNSALQKRKRFYSTDKESSHSDTDSNNEIQRDISTSPTIVDDNQVKKITEYNSTLKKRKRFYSTDEESSHSDTDSNNEIQRDISTSPTIVVDNQVKKITEYNSALQKRKRFYSTDEETSHSDTDSNNEILVIQRLHNQNLRRPPATIGYFNKCLYAKLNGLELYEQIEEDAEIVFRKSNYFDPFKRLSDRQFILLYRLSKELARKVINMVTPYMKASTRSDGLTIQKKVITALKFFASGEYQTDKGISRIIEEVTTALCRPEIFEEIVLFPRNIVELNTVEKGFYEEFNVQGIVGVVDCTHVAIEQPPKTNDLNYPEHIYLNRKGYHSINTQLICDVNLRILNVSARYPGSFCGSHIWNTSIAKTLMINLHDEGHQSFMLLGDSEYALRPWLITPFVNPCPDTPEENFNDTVCKARSTIERCNRLLKMRFRCLLKHQRLQYAPKKASKIIESCVVLHNLCIMYNIPLYNVAFDTLELDYGIFQQNNVENDQIDDEDNPALIDGQQVRQQIVHRYFT